MRKYYLQYISYATTNKPSQELSNKYIYFSIQWQESDAFSETSQIYEMNLFEKTVNKFQ